MGSDAASDAVRAVLHECTAISGKPEGFGDGEYVAERFRHIIARKFRIVGDDA